MSGVRLHQQQKLSTLQEQLPTATPEVDKLHGPLSSTFVTSMAQSFLGELKVRVLRL